MPSVNVTCKLWVQSDAQKNLWHKLQYQHMPVIKECTSAPDEIINMLVGGIVLVLSWILVSLVHEYFHSLTAMALGYEVSIKELAFNSGSMVVKGIMTDVDTSIVALSGFMGLTAFGLALIYLTDLQSVHMAGVIFLSRAWIDSMPLYDLDGALIAQSSTPYLAWILLLFEVLISGAAIMHVIKGRCDFERQIPVKGED